MGVQSFFGDIKGAKYYPLICVWYLAKKNIVASIVLMGIVKSVGWTSHL